MIGPRDKSEAIVVALFPTVFMVIIDTLLLPGVVNGVRSESFEPTPGVVTRSEIAGGHKGAVDYEIEYQYTVNGQQYTSKEYHVQPQFFGNSAWRAVRDANPVGKPVTVYHDPGNPATAYLVPGLRSDMLLVFWVLIPFNLLAAGLWWNAWNRRRRAFDPALSRCVRETSDGWLVRPDPAANFVVIACAALAVTTFLGSFLAFGCALLLDGPPPWIVPIAMYVLAGVIAVAVGVYGNRRSLIFVSEQKVEFSPQDQFARTDILGIDVTTETEKSDGKSHEVYTVSLRWRDKFDQERSALFAKYDEEVDATALVGWLHERLGLPGEPPKVGLSLATSGEPAPPAP